MGCRYSAASASELAMKNNVYQMPGIAAFSDEFRDSLRGPFGGDEKKELSL